MKSPAMLSTQTVNNLTHMSEVLAAAGHPGIKPSTLARAILIVRLGAPRVKTRKETQ